ncbi:coiled-coil domain-containing protein 87 [Tiliqua scincoides]|uniref:coiled-coil domain-containing protein 87 n=1 Tax=Tiliqua scincoides TaxID=71010 RepID=UPI003461E2C0
MAAPRRIYPLEETEGRVRQAQQQYRRIQAPLALFPASYSRVKPPAAEEPPCAGPAGQRPPAGPLSQAALLELVEARLEPGPRSPRVPPAVQAAFRAVILDEVRRVWKDMQLTLSDPGGSLRANRQLYQRLVAYVGLACQHLFLHHLRLAQRSHRLDVFTDSANLARYCTQLSLACAGLLDVAAVRHRLVTEMKILRFRPPGRAQGLSGPGLTISHLIGLMRPRVLTMRQRLAREVKELEDLPPLDLSKIKDFVLPAPRPFWKEMTCAAVTTACPQLPASPSKIKQGRAHPVTATHARRSQSLPNMRVGQLLADELGIHLSLRPLSPDLPTHYAETVESEEEGELKRLGALTEDLRRLVQGPVLKTSQWKGDLNEESELPPLIKALTLRKTNEIRYQQLKRMLHSLQQEEANAQRQRQTLICAPASFPQAATVNFDVHNKMVVKAADLQVSERVYLEAVAMERCPAVYNHLLGEIDTATIKALDAELFAGEEVREIYKELMNTIPKEHLMFNLGSLSEHAAADLERDLCFASSTLTRKKGEQIINEELSKILPAGPFAFDDVVDTVKTPNLPFKKRGAKHEYVSWLKWWKATFNTDNFLQYVSNKESDYLQVIFHLYSCEDEEEKEPVLDEAEIKRQVQEKKAAIKRAVELQSKTDKYQPGEWECNVSTLGSGMPAVTPEVTPGVMPVVSPGTGTGTAVPGQVPFSYDHRPEELRVLQRRLERLWTVLHFSERERLDMAIKYSTNNYYYLLPDMLHSWELAAQAIQERELLLAELEKFEFMASDPNRFFRKMRKSFRVRLSESRIRSQLYFMLGQYNSELRALLNHIQEMFNDVVTFKGRPYLKKMEWDVVEMLYWLQQGRRANVLRREVQRGSQKLPPVLSRHHCTEQHTESELETHKFYEEMSSSFLDLQGSSFLMGPKGEEPGRLSSSFEM